MSKIFRASHSSFHERFAYYFDLLLEAAKEGLDFCKGLELDEFARHVSVNFFCQVHLESVLPQSLRRCTRFPSFLYTIIRRSRGASVAYRLFFVDVAFGGCSSLIRIVARFLGCPSLEFGS